MKIRILESAREDLKEGFYFYESQERGVGSYFLESLFSDIASLKGYTIKMPGGGQGGSKIH